MTPSPLAAARIEPLQQEKLAPCCARCAGGVDVRGWIAVVAQCDKLGLARHEAFTRAWNLVTAVNPFPAVLGRICPHPCETECSRSARDRGIAINALERFLGDWGLAQRLPLPRLEAAGSRPESIGVIGSGPAGLSFAYQMARRGYRVTVYEKQPKPGGMLYYGIPEYRLPESVLEAEVRRILDLGVALRPGTAVGRDVPLAALRRRHEVLFLGIGAGRGLALGVPGENGAGTWTGVDYLARVNRGEAVELGCHVAVIGGGNTAIDAARAARRSGARVTVLYRRTRAEMPAIGAEIEEAVAEGVRIEYLTAPVAIVREDRRVRAVVVRCMELGAPDASGRRIPVPVPGSEHELPVDSVVAAVSQQPDWEGLSEVEPAKVWMDSAVDTELASRVWTGGDTRGLGIAGEAVLQGRLAAEAAHGRLQGVVLPAMARPEALRAGAVKPDVYPAPAPVTPPRTGVDWSRDPDAELEDTISEEEFLREASRCFSCGLCYGCEQCFMFCTAGAFVRLPLGSPGAYFGLRRDLCLGCGKCTDLCPCGFLTPIQTAPPGPN